MAKKSDDRLTRADIGAWIVQGNPQLTWDYFAFLDENGLAYGSDYVNVWTLHPSYRVELMEPGDPIVLWLTGVKKGDYWPAIYEIGVIDDFPEESFGIDETHILDPNYQHRSGFTVEFISRILPTPLRSVDLRADPTLAGCEKFRVPMLGNPLHLTPAETVALSRHLPKAALKAVLWADALKRAKYTTAKA